MTAGARQSADLEAEWARALKILAGAPEICLACHVRPDGDALGSMLAVATALCGAAAASDHPPRRVIASFGDQPFEVPQNLRFLPGVELLTPPAGYPRRPAVMMTFDAASEDRLGLKLTRDIALDLYAGLVTDTGSFKFSTTPRTHYLAAELLSTGLDPAAVGRELFDRAPFGYLGLLSAVLGRATLERSAAGGLGLVWTAVTRADRAPAALPLDTVEPVIDVLRRTSEAEVAVVLKEADDGAWLVSARSKGLLDVGRACTALGGGGHAQAAGFTAHGSADEAIAALRERLGE